MSGPRQASPPRRPAAARRPGAHATGRDRAARASAGEAATGATLTPRDPHTPAGQASPPAPARELSAWQQLLAELDRLLRDPTLTRALKAFAAKVAAGLRDLPAVVGAASRSLVRALARIRLPRRLLLGLLALLLPLALLVLLSSSDDDPAGGARGQPAPPAEGASGGLSLPAVGMPQLVAQPDEVRPVRVALVFDRTYDTPALQRELQVLSGWLAENHAPGTRISVIDATSARASPPLSAARLAAAEPTRRRASTSSAVRRALAGRADQRLLVTLGTPAPAPGAAKTLRIATRPGAATGSSAVLAQRSRSRVTIDERRPNALAASVARAIMAVSGEREKR